jgi:hypothetical protein
MAIVMGLGSGSRLQEELRVHTKALRDFEATSRLEQR